MRYSIYHATIEERKALRREVWIDTDTIRTVSVQVHRCWFLRKSILIKLDCVFMKNKRDGDDSAVVCLD